MQPGLFDLDSRYEQLDKLGDPLPTLSALVDWEGFRSLLSRTRQKARKSGSGRKPYDEVLMFKRCRPWRAKRWPIVPGRRQARAYGRSRVRVVGPSDMVKTVCKARPIRR